MQTISTEERRAALCARHHLDGTGTSVVEVTSDLVALHSSDPLTPHLACWARMPDYETAMLDDGFPERVWRLHAMRRTLWIATAEEVGMLYAAVGEKVHDRERRRIVQRIDRPDADAWLTTLGDEVATVVAEEPGIDTRRLKERIPALETPIVMGSGKWTGEVPVGSRLLFLLAMELRIARLRSTGSWKASQYPWVVAPETARMPAAQARTRLVERYLGRFAPVTTVDVQWWTGLTAAQVRGALEALDAVEVALDDGPGWMLPGQALPEAGGVALLPGLDPTPMGYKERSWFLGSHGASLFDRNGNIGPTAWVDGRIVGGWAVREDGTVALETLEDLTKGATDALEDRRRALERWLDGTGVTPRFRTPLEKTLVAGE